MLDIVQRIRVKIEILDDILDEKVNKWQQEANAKPQNIDREGGQAGRLTNTIRGN